MLYRLTLIKHDEVVKEFQQRGTFQDPYSPVLGIQELRVPLSVAVYTSKGCKESIFIWKN